MDVGSSNVLPDFNMPISLVVSECSCHNIVVALAYQIPSDNKFYVVIHTAIEALWAPSA